MSRFWPRLLKSVLPVALLAGGVGYLYAVAAGAYTATSRDDGTSLTESLVGRVPLSMASWGGGIALLFELLRHLWGGPKAKAAPVAATAVPDAEQLLLQLLEQAEAAEHNRNQPDLQEPPPPFDPPVTTDLPVSAR